MSAVNQIPAALRPMGEWPLLRRLSVLALAVLMVTMVPLLPPGPGQVASWAVGLTLALAFLMLDVLGLARRWLAQRALVQLHALLAEDATPCIATDDLGQVVYRNRAAAARFGEAEVTLAASLGDVVAHPSAVLYRLQGRARRSAMGARMW